MMVAQPQSASSLDASSLIDWIIQRGLLGLTLEEQFGGLCEKLYENGIPMARATMAMGTLHPRYGSHAFIWRDSTRTVEYDPQAHGAALNDSYLKSPVYHMLENEVEELRYKLETNRDLPFPILDDLRADGMTEYSARIVSYGKISEEMERKSGVFFSCATRNPGGFPDDYMNMLEEALPHLALSIKSRTTYDIATTVIETYLGKDAGRRVFTGEIERGSVSAIRAAIWLCDLRGFTRFSDAAPQDELVATLDDYLEAMARPVHEHGGQILKFLGDGFLATFDVSDADANTGCADALQAAREFRSGLDAFNAERRAAGARTMDVGLALHLGEVLYGNIGASDRHDFTVVGPAVNEVSRIEALCRPLERRILISKSFEEAAQAAPGALMSLGFHVLRGIREPQELFTLPD